MHNPRPDADSLLGKPFDSVPASCQRVIGQSSPGSRLWIGPDQAEEISAHDRKAYELAHLILCHLAIRAPLKHKSGHPGGPLSAFTAAYFINQRRNPSVDQPLRMSAGHLSLLAYGLEWLFGREGEDARLSSPQSIIDSFRTADGLPGHIEAGIGTIPFGTGPLGKGVSNAVGAAFGLKMQQKNGIVDVILADGDSQEGQVAEAFRLASALNLDNLIVHGDFNDIQLSGMPSKTVAADFASIAYAEGWNVIEVQNGNDAGQVVSALIEAEKLLGSGRPTFICYYTTMGYGVPLMEQGSNTGKKNYHGSPLSDSEAKEALSVLPDFDDATVAYEPFRAKEKTRFNAHPSVETDLLLDFSAGKNGYERTLTEGKGAARKEFGALHLKNLMKSDKRIVVLHADLAGSGGFDKVEKDFPDRVINVGVAEANMLMMAAGMRQTGLLPVTYTFAAFSMNEARANARLIDINCGHTRCGIINDATHAGLSVGEDGETHQERNYLNIPFDHTQVWMPADSNQAGAMAERAMELIAEGHTSVYVFSPRTGHEQIRSSEGELFYGKDYAFHGQIDRLRGTGTTADQVTILATGITVHAALEAAADLASSQVPIAVRVLNVGCVRPIDSATIIAAALETRHLVVVEDHNSEGGLATQVADIIADFGLPSSLRRLGVNHYFPSAPAEDLFFLAGIDRDSIVNAAEDEARIEMRGGEDAFVSCIYELIHNMRFSRFRESASPFLHRLLTEEGYLEQLRAVWSQLEPEELPSNTELLEKLEESAEA